MSKIQEITFVTGLWDIGRGELDNTSSNHDWKRTFKTYTDRLEELLSSNLPIVVYGESEIELIVQKYKNAIYMNYPKENFYQMSIYENIQTIRTSKEWYDQPTAQWLKSSPQAMLPLYVPIQLTKLYLIKKTCETNPYQSSRFYWIDAGITKTHDIKLFPSMIPKLMKYEKFMFLSHLYRDNTEIHGFLREGMNKHCQVSFVERIMKGFFFGGVVNQINEIITLYNQVLIDTLHNKYLGCDETYFTIMIHQKPELFDKVLIPHCFNTMLSF